MKYLTTQSAIIITVFFLLYICFLGCISIHQNNEEEENLLESEESNDSNNFIL